MENDKHQIIVRNEVEITVNGNKNKGEMEIK